jgi:hypothetical protein
VVLNIIRSLYDLVCFGYLDKAKLDEELKEYDLVVEGRELHHRALDSLFDLLSLDDDKFDENWTLVLKSLENGEYGINDLRNIASVYEIYSSYGVDFKINRHNLYKLLHEKLDEIIEFKIQREDHYQYMRDEEIFSSHDYRGFIELTHDKVYKLMQKQNTENVKNTLNNMQKKEDISSAELSNLIQFGSKSDIHELAKLVSRSTSDYKFFEKYFDRSLKELRSIKDERDNIGEKFKLLIEKCKEYTKDNNVVKANISIMQDKIKKDYFN